MSNLPQLPSSATPRHPSMNYLGVYHTPEEGWQFDIYSSIDSVSEAYAQVFVETRTGAVAKTHVGGDLRFLIEGLSWYIGGHLSDEEGVHERYLVVYHTPEDQWVFGRLGSPRGISDAYAQVVVDTTDGKVMRTHVSGDNWRFLIAGLGVFISQKLL